MWTNELMTGAGALLERSAVVSNEDQAPTTRSPRSALPIAMLGVAFDNVTLAQTLERIEEMVESRRTHYIVTANVDFLVQARRDVELRRILNDAHLVLCDGTPLVWASRLLGNPLPERVAGSDVMPRLIRVAAEKGYRLYFLGATPDANAQAVANVRAQFPNVVIAGHYSPPFQPLLEMDHEEIAQRIRAAQPDLLFVSFGCPKAEKWIAMHYRTLGVPVTIGVGATIDFLAGRVKRAPLWMQRAGVEWIFRMIQEPRRLFRRYATDLWHFGWAMAEQGWGLKIRASRVGPQGRCSVAMVEPTWHRIQAPERLDANMARSDAWIWEGADGRHCLLDLSDVRFIDSTCVGLLLQLRKRLETAGRCLVLLAPSRAVQRALKSLRVADFFVTAQDALEARDLIAARTNRASPVEVNALRPLSWRGEITSVNAEEVWKLTEAQFLSLGSRQSKIVVDLSEVRFIDSTAVGLMLRAKQEVQRRGALLRFAGAQPNVHNVVRLAKLESLLLEGAA